MLQTPKAMKKKVLTSLIAVIIGHVGVLFTLSHMDAPTLKPIEKDPIKVRFVQIKEDAPPPPPPAEPVKPKVEPKPVEPKPVEPKPVTQPKVIAEKPKPQPKKEQPVVVQQDDTLEKQRLEKQRLEIERQNQERLEQQQREQQERAENERREQERREQQARNTPKSLSIGQISWSRSPKPSYTNKDLQGADRTIVVSIEADTNGNITNARIVRSSGVDALDQKILRSVRSSKFKPYKENGVAYAFKAEQPFELKLNPNG